ncbi:MAG: S1/P1 nuclease [Planctomycetes bacterium]|nr:S1/P1 nuclease [Planctomycetota bacterium]MBI3845178.1 S1/P1 nuclease [Planctomycetota bacterium]
MRLFRTGILFLSLCGLPTPPLAHAWDAYGHELSATIAYQDLKPTAKARVDELLRKHPHYDLLSKNCPAGFDKEMFVFMRAAVWADMMRDERLDPGGKEHHGPWHYVNLPIGPDISRRPIPDLTWKPGSDPDNVVQALQKCEIEVHDSETPDAEKAKRLCWIEHLVGDVHQPLHTVSMFSKEFEQGDAGGNGFVVSEKGKVQKLHAFWDGVLGFSEDPRAIAKRGDDLRKSHDLSRGALASDLAHGTYSDWVNAGAELAKTVAYDDGKLQGAKSVDKDHLPAKAPELPSGYRKKAETVAQKQIALAGYRLADTLNRVLSSSHP